MSEIDTSSELFRHQCEVRYVLNLGSIARMKEYLDMVKEKRRPAAYERLAGDVRRELEAMRGKGRK